MDEIKISKMEKDLEKVQSAAEFIQIVKKEKSIYDFTDPDYKIAENKALAWERVALKSDMTVELAKRRWKNLRDSYTKYLKSFKNLESQDSLTYVRKYKYWAHAEAMDFLKPFQGPPRSRKKDFYDNIRIINANDYESMPYGEEENNFDLSSQLYEKMNSNDSDMQHSSFNQETAYNVNESQYDINNSSYGVPEYPDDIQKIPFGNELKHHLSIPKQSMPAIEYNNSNGIIQNSSIPNKKISLKATDLDSTSLFFLSLAKSVRKMPLKYQAKIKVQCLQIVNEMELNLELTNSNTQNKKKVRKLTKETQQDQQECNINSEHFTYEMSPAMIEIVSSDDENLAENRPK